MKPMGLAVFSNKRRLSNGIEHIAHAIDGQGDPIDALILNRRVYEILNDHKDTAPEIQQNLTIRDATSAMSNNGTGLVLVYHNKTFTGILCSAEIRRALIEEGVDTSIAKYTIAAKNLIKIAHDQSVADALDLFDKYKVKRLIVMKDDGSIGDLTTGRLLRWIGRELTAIVKAGV